MKIKINVKKIHLIILLLIISITGIYFVVAQLGALPNPGHTASQISGVCKSDGTGCNGITPLSSSSEIIYLVPGTYYCGDGNAFLCRVSSGPPVNIIWTTRFNYNSITSRYETTYSYTNPGCTYVLCTQDI